jgi:hypothetical protein
MPLQERTHSNAAALVPVVATHISQAAEYTLMASPDKLEQLRTFTFPFDVDTPLTAPNLQVLADAAKVSCRLSLGNATLLLSLVIGCSCLGCLGSLPATGMLAQLLHYN